jgi:amino acid transporter
MPAMTPGNNPIPYIDYYTSRPITVDTSVGPRDATEVTIIGGNFRIRAKSAKVLVNGVPLARYVIAEDERSITGYFFGPLQRPATIVVEYDPVVRTVWAESGSPSTGAAAPATGFTFSPLVILLLVLLLLLVVALVVAFGVAGGSGVLLGLLIAALVVLAVALVLALRL